MIYKKSGATIKLRGKRGTCPVGTHPALRLWMLLLLLMSTSGALAIEFESVEPKDINSSFETLFEDEGAIEYNVVGSGIEKKEFLWKADGLKRAYIIWAGQIPEELEKAVKTIELELPSKRKVKVSAQKFYTVLEEGRKKTYCAVAEITKWVFGSGRYKVKGLKTDGFGGYAVLGIKKGGSRKLILGKVGLARIKPADLYQVNLHKGMKGKVTQMTTIGGNGIAGNGSSNLLNGVTVSGKDDWDGSEGSKWDVDHYDIGKFDISSEKGVFWEIDPLLQWLYPIGAVVAMEGHRP